MKMTILLAEKIREVDTADPIGGDDFSELAYPVFLASVSEPESKSGSVCDWLEPRLLAVLEQWEAWRKNGEVQSVSTAKISVLGGNRKKNIPPALSLPFYQQESARERKRSQPKTETRVSDDLNEIFV